MSADAKWIVGVVVGVVVGTWIATLGVVVTLNGGVRADLREMRAEMRAFDERLRAVEVAFGKVDQRLETLERAIIPAAPPAD